MAKKTRRVVSLTLAIIILSISSFSCSTNDAVSAPEPEENQEGSFTDTTPNTPVMDYIPAPTNVPQAGSEKNKDEPMEIEIIFEKAQSFVETPLLADLSDYEIIGNYEAGTVFYIMEYETPLWVYVKTEDDSEGFLYSDDLYALEEDGSPAASPLGQTKIADRLNELHELFPSGYYWNHIGYDEDGVDYSEYVTGFPCDHDVTGTFYCNHYDGTTLTYYPQYDALYQCLGFASLISDKVFGTDAGISSFSHYEDLRLGDHIRLHDYAHSMVVVAIHEDDVIVAEVNENYNDCAINWEHRISLGELQSLSWDSEYLTRYPTFRDSAGNLLTNGSFLAILN